MLQSANHTQSKTFMFNTLCMRVIIDILDEFERQNQEEFYRIQEKNEKLFNLHKNVPLTSECLPPLSTLYIHK